jgi:hypothetical protein
MAVSGRGGTASHVRGAGGRRAAAAALGIALLLGGSACWPPLPVLLLSDPAPGAVVARSAWLVLTFAEAPSVPASRRLSLVCDDTLQLVGVHRLAGGRVIVNPRGELPAGAACTLDVYTVEGRVQIPFTTRAAGAPFAVVHDRTDVDLALPFPDDFFLDPDASTATGFRPRIAAPDHSLSVESILTSMGYAVEAEADGWSPIGPTSIEISAAPDPRSLPLSPEASLDPLATVGLFDVTPGSSTFGERIPFALTIREDTIEPAPTQYLLVIFPGIPLEPRGQYVLAVTRRVLDTAGEPLAASAFHAATLGPAQPGEPAQVAQARPLALEVAALLEGLHLPFPREDVAVAVRLTTRSVDHFPDDLLVMREQVFATPASVQIESVEPRSGAIAALVHGRFEAPRWRAGAFLARDAEGRPQVIGALQIPFVLALPRSAETDGHAPLIMYQHGNPGSAQGSVPNQGWLAAQGFAVGGFTDILNRLYPDTFDQQLAIFSVILATGQVPEFYLQTYGEQLAFVQALGSLDDLDVLPVGAPDGLPDLDPSVISYEGISYGSVHGQAFLAYAPEIRAASLVVGAFRLTETLVYQDMTRPLGGPAFLTEVLPDFVTGVTPRDVAMALALFAAIYDRQDPHNHARHIYRNPVTVAGTTQKSSILVVEGINDSFTTNPATRSLAWLLGPIPQLSPVKQRVSILPLAAPPVQGNVDAATSAAFVQFAPSGIPGMDPSPGCIFQPEGHYCAQTAPESRALRARFYQSALGASAPRIEGP